MAAIAAAILYPVARALDWPASVALVAKGATVGSLALLAFARRRELPGGALLATAFAAHAAGDVLLERWFLAGVAAFLVGHLLYVALFWRERRSIEELSGASKLALGLLALASAGCVVVLAPRLAGLQRIAIPLYVAALIAMAGSALHCRRGRPWLPVGALLFVASDALLAFELFAGGAAGARNLIWPLYAAAQLAIAWGWCFGASEPPASGHGPDAPA